VRSSLKKNAEKAITDKMKKYVTADKVAEEAMKPLLNADGNVYMKYAVRGTLSSPDVKMVAPSLPDMKDIIKKAAGGAVEQVKDAAKEAAAEKAEEGKAKAAEKAKAKAKKIKVPKL
ncbi:MAG: hypothetical protein ACRCUT_13825, partial [Spirochaetota bacterium]